jgi:hypothetical protein
MYCIIYLPAFHCPRMMELGGRRMILMERRSESSKKLKAATGE